MKKTLRALHVARPLHIGICLTLLLAIACPVRLLAQTDIRAYRGVNRVIIGTRALQPNEGFPGGIVAGKDGERHPVFKMGAGCFVSKDGFMLTANHVVTGDGLSFFVGGIGSRSDPVVALEVKARNPELDLALIKIEVPSDMPSIAVPFVDSSTIQEGLAVFVWAYLRAGSGFMQFLRSGLISNSSDGKAGKDHVIYIESTAIDGTSGAPVFLRDGRPLGIVTSRLLVGSAQLPAGVLAIVPGEEVNKFLKNAGVPSH